MDLDVITKALVGLPLGNIRYFAIVGSTNEMAAHWAATENACDLSLVIADEQTAGRGRGGNRWMTPPRSALAFSLVLRLEEQVGNEFLSRFSALGAMAVSDALLAMRIPGAEIKWPNDVLMQGKKIAGVLPEAQWIGDHLQSVILGIGINVSPASVPPNETLAFPAACLELAAARKVSRTALLRQVLRALIQRRQNLHTAEFLRDWEQRLAFRRQRVQVISGAASPVEGTLLGLTPEGCLRLQKETGEEVIFPAGEVHLRPVDSLTNSTTL